MLRKLSRQLGQTQKYIYFNLFSQLNNLNYLKLLFIETPTNPKLIVTDIKAVAQICEEHKIIFAIDNSFMTPYLQRPLELGATLVIYSVTKFINGHVDVLMGAVLTNDEELYEKLRLIQRGN